VESAYKRQGHLIELGFANSGLNLIFEPLTSGGGSENWPSLGPGDTLPWKGNYVVLAEQVDDPKPGHSVLDYFRIRSQSMVKDDPRGGESGIKEGAKTALV
jgi:hypothetical protein